MAKCDALLEICDSDRVRPEKRIIIIKTRQLQSLVTVKELTSIETRQTVGLAIGWIDIVGIARPVI